MTLEERVTLIRHLGPYREQGKHLAVSVADNAIDNSRVLCEAAASSGADLVMVSCPNYFSNTLEMVIAHFNALAGFYDLNLCLYDNPAASHTVLSVNDIIEIVEAVPAIVAVKVTDRSYGKVAALKQRTSLSIYAGEDAVLWHQLDDAADGAMVAAPLIFPDACAKMWEEFKERPADSGPLAISDAYREMAPFIQVALGAYDYPAVIKAVLREQGLISSDEVRMPLLPLSETRRTQVLQTVTAPA